MTPLLPRLHNLWRLRCPDCGELLLADDPAELAAFYADHRNDQHPEGETA